MDTLDTFRVSHESVPSCGCPVPGDGLDTVHAGVDLTSM